MYAIFHLHFTDVKMAYRLVTCTRSEHLYSRGKIWTQGFPCGSAGKESACNAEDLGSTPEWGRSPGEGKGCLLQYSGLENPMDYIVHRVAKSGTRLGDWEHSASKSIFLSATSCLEMKPGSTACESFQKWVMKSKGRLHVDVEPRVFKSLHPHHYT